MQQSLCHVVSCSSYVSSPSSRLHTVDQAILPFGMDQCLSPLHHYATLLPVGYRFRWVHICSTISLLPNSATMVLHVVLFRQPFLSILQDHLCPKYNLVG